MPEFANKKGLKERRLKDSIKLLPIFAIILMTSPFIAVFQWDFEVFGAPGTVIYVFLIWFGLIIAAQNLSRKLFRHLNEEHK